MQPYTHKNCLGVRGIKSFKCPRCGKDGGNYSNGIDLCYQCCIDTNTCPICGEEVREAVNNPKIDYDKILNNWQDKVIDLADKYDSLAEDCPTGSKDYFRYKNYAMGLNMALSMLSVEERKVLRKVSKGVNKHEA